MQRYGSLAALVCAFIVALGILGAGGSGAAARTDAVRPAAPAVDCTVDTITLGLTLQGSVAASRSFTNTAGDSFVQFGSVPFTTTAASTTGFILDPGFSGTVSGTLTGSLASAPLNGVLVTAAGGPVPNPRGFSGGRVILTTDQGTITGTLALNVGSLSFTSPYYPRLVGGFLASNDMSGALAGKLLVVPVFGQEDLAGGTVTLTANGAGRLYSGAAPVMLTFVGTRSAPDNRTVAFSAGDVISQFRSPPFALGSAGSGRIQPAGILAGNISGTSGPTGTYAAALNSLLLDSPSAGRGWQAGSLALTDANTDVLAAVWAGDLTNTNTLRGTLYQVAGTGAYSTTLLFGDLSGTYFVNGTVFAGQLTGSYCSGIAQPTATVTATSPAATATATATSPAATVTATATGNAATATTTAISAATATATATSPAATATATTTAIQPTATATGPVATATATATGPAATATTTPTGLAATPSTTRTPSTSPSASATAPATATACGIRFSDVPYNDPTVYYAVPVYYLACHGVVSGYSDGTFRPYNQTTRQQMVKIVVLGFALPLQTPPAGGTTFTDVPPTSAFFLFVETAAARGIVSGYACGGSDPATGLPEPCNGTAQPYFRPASNVTRAQLAKITVLAAGWATVRPATATFNDVPPGSTFYPFIETAVCHSILSGYSCGSDPGEPCPGLYYRPSNNATRGQISKIVYNALNSGPTCGTR